MTVTLSQVSSIRSGTVVCPYGAADLEGAQRKALESSGADLNDEGMQWIVEDGASPKVVSLARGKYDLCHTEGGFHYAQDTKILLKRAGDGSGWVLDHVIDPVGK